MTPCVNLISSLRLCQVAYKWTPAVSPPLSRGDACHDFRAATQSGRVIGAMSTTIKDRTAIVGIGQTQFGKGLEDSELSLACQAISLAIDDAGIAPSEVDGLASFSMEPGREVEVAKNVGLGDITWF